MTDKLVGNPDDIMRSVDEVAVWLKLSRVTVWTWVNAGMPCITLHNGRRWYSKTQISLWIAENDRTVKRN
jgi:hypothetical protein